MGSAYITPVHPSTEISDSTAEGRAFLTTGSGMEAMGNAMIAHIRKVSGFTTNHPGAVWFATIKATDSLNINQITTSTGYFRVVKSDGSLGAQQSAGFATIATEGAGGSLRAAGIISVVNGGSVPSGNIIALTCDSNQLTSLNVTGLTALTTLYCYSNQLTSLNVTGLTALTILSCYSNQLTSLNVTGLTALAYITCYSNHLTSFVLVDCGYMSVLFGSTSEVLYATGITPMAAWTVSAYGGSYIYLNGLKGTAAELNAFYTSMPTVTGSKTITLTGAPNVGTSNTAILTGKGYTVIE